MFVIGFTLYSFNQPKDLIVGTCIGVLLTSFSDLQGSFRHRSFAMMLSVITNIIILIVINFSAHTIGLSLLFIGCFAFILANVSVFGNRASTYSLSGLLCIVFSLIEYYPIKEFIPYCIAFIGGCVLYIIASVIYHSLTRKNQSMERLGELTRLTSEYLKLRLNKKGLSKSKLDDEIFSIQNLITEKQEDIRNLILTERQYGGQSQSRNRRLLIFIELIDIMELAVANPTKLLTAKEHLEDGELPHFQKITNSIAKRLGKFSNFILDRKKLKKRPNFEEMFSVAEQAIGEYINKIGLPEARKGSLMRRDLLDYLKNQVKNLDSIERLLFNVSRQRQVDLTKKIDNRFLSKEDYSPFILKENLNIKAPIFRHAIRISIAMIIGYGFATLIKVENPYWVLLSTVVIMRPAYGLTRKRSNERVLGTIIGVIIAILLFQISTNIYFFVAIATFTMLFAFSLLQRNYTIAATAITLNVIFIFVLIDSNHWEIISYRLIDTFIGALVSILVSYTVLPNWEYVSIRNALVEVVEKNRDYLLSISGYYKNPGDDIDYRLKRREAFLATSELNGAFQRYTKDPKSKKGKFPIYYELVTLNQTMLSTLANLGSYIKDHHKAKLESEFNEISNSIASELTTLIKNMKDKDSDKSINKSNSQLVAEENIGKLWEKLEGKRTREIEEGKRQIDENFRLQLREVNMIQQELNWLQSITENMEESIRKL